MASVLNRVDVKCTSISAVVTRANGKVEPLGVISFRHRNPFIHYPVNFYIWIKERLRK